MTNRVLCVAIHLLERFLGLLRILLVRCSKLSSGNGMEWVLYVANRIGAYECVILIHTCNFHSKRTPLRNPANELQMEDAISNSVTGENSVHWNSSVAAVSSATYPL